MNRLRTPLAVVNELSLPAPKDGLDDDDLTRRFGLFVDVLRAARRIRPDLAVTSAAPLSSLPVTADYRPLGAVMGSQAGRARDQWRYLQTLRSHAPFSEAPSLVLVDHAEEYRLGEDLADGLGLAAANRQLAVSWSGDEWDRTFVEIDRFWLEESEREDLVERTETASAVHSSTPAHIGVHERFLRELALPVPFGGAEIWADRKRLFPNLRFLERVEAQLTSFPPAGGAFSQVVERLRQLDRAVADWDPRATAAPVWQSKVTPESDSRKGLCNFRDVDGTVRCFELHARYTPGAGRIHFLVSDGSEGPLLVVAHVGPKL